MAVNTSNGGKKKRTGRPGLHIVTTDTAPVKGETAAEPPPRKRGRPGRPKTRRQSHGSAWHWKQTDVWYYTLPGTKRRVPLVDEDGQKIRGKENRDKARLALARVKLTEEGERPAALAPTADWLVARVCSEYLQYCDRGVNAGTISADHRNAARHYLNDLCKYCGGLPVGQLKKAHVQTWIDGQKGWKSPATERTVLTIVLAALTTVTPTTTSRARSRD